MKNALFSVFMVTVGILACASAAYADSTTTAGPQVLLGGGSCDVTISDIAIIKTIQSNSSLGYGAELQQELDARRNLLSKTILCAKVDAEQAKTNLTSAMVDSDLENLKNQWSDKLDGAISYYDLQLQKVGVVGISGTESIAKEVLDWRKNNYAPLAQNVSNFVMWSNNQTLFTTAENRLAQINHLVTSPVFSQNPDVPNDYEEAAVALKAAEDQNVSAKNAFSQSLSPDQTLLFIKQSLDSLSSTYQHFFEISGLIQSLLPQ